MKKALLSLAVSAAMGLASVQASAVELMDFTIDEASVPGGLANTFVADKLVGGYQEVISFNGLGGFDSQIIWNGGQLWKNDGFTQISAHQIGGFTSNQYQMYALMSASGTVGVIPPSLALPLGGYTFTGASASMQWYIDPLSDSTQLLGATGTSSSTVTNNADDYMIASASSLNYGEGHIFTGQANGDFQIGFGNLVLTTGDNSVAFGGLQNGDSYFTQPRPFYVNLDAAGQLNSFSVTGTQTINGSADITFVPEPGVLGLMGLGLIGLAASSRRRKV